MSATDLEVVNEAMRRRPGSNAYTLALDVLRLKADGWTPPNPHTVQWLASRLLNSVSATNEAYATEIRVFLAKHTKDMLKPDADGWIKSPNGIDYVVNDARAIIGGQGVCGDTNITQVRFRT